MLDDSILTKLDKSIEKAARYGYTQLSQISVIMLCAIKIYWYRTTGALIDKRNVNELILIKGTSHTCKTP